MEYSINKAENLLTIRLDGCFDGSYYEQFNSICEEHNDPNYHFNVDFGKTEYIDSSALGMLLLLREKTQGDMSRVTLVNVSDESMSILKIAHFHQLFTVKLA